jgi:tetratricopeptide (TPR) repeat protein
MAGLGEDALNDYTRALEIFASLSDGRRGRGITLGSLARTLNTLGRYAEAIVNAEEARDLFESINDAEDEAIVLITLGDSHKGLTCAAEALEFYQSALRLQRNIDHRYGVANTLNAIGQLYADLKQTPGRKRVEK